MMNQPSRRFLAIGAVMAALLATAIWLYVGDDSSNSTSVTRSESPRPVIPAPGVREFQDELTPPEFQDEGVPQIEFEALPARPPGHIEVFVRDRLGMPVEGARVSLEYLEFEGAMIDGNTILEALSDSNGIASLSELPWGTVWLTAERNGATASMRQIFHPGEYSEEIVLILRPSEKAFGRVETDRGIPVPNARVVVCEHDLSESSELLGASWARTTDGSGRFQFDSLPLGMYRFRAYAEGFAPGESDAVRTNSGQEAVVRLCLASSISGIVRSSITGAPLRGIELVLKRTGTRQSKQLLQTDDKGSFLFAGLARGTYDLYASPSGVVLTDGLVRIDVPPSRQLRDVVLTAQDGVTVRGHVLDAETHAPIPGVLVRGVHQAHPALVVNSDHTDSGGNYAIEGVAPGVNHLWAVWSSGRNSSRAVFNAFSGKNVDNFDILVPGGVDVQGVVLNVSESPVAGAVVSAAAWNDDIDTPWNAKPTRTDGAGHFTFAGCPPDFNLTLQAASVLGRSNLSGPYFVPPEGLSNIVLRLTNEELGTISGRVVTREGDPVFAWVNATPTGQQLGDMQGSVSGRTDMDGIFAIPTVPAGEYELFVGRYNPDGFQSASLSGGRIVVEAGQYLTDIEIVMDLGAGAITGSVTDDQSRPMAGVIVSARTYGDPDAQSHDSMSDATGGFQISDLPEDFYVVSLSVSGYEGQSAKPLAPGDDVEFVLTPLPDDGPPLSP